jgi:peptidoglycan/LPS O-acetylase OafA/YrhL
LLGFRPGESCGAILARHRGIGPGFDVLRFLLAILLLVGHTRWLGAAPSIGLLFTQAEVANATGQAGAGVTHWVGFTKPLLRALVPAFFALSGFLVLGSAFRLRKTSTFLAHRALRILPALFVEVTLSALILGPLLTKLPLRAYFANPEFARYFGNVVGWITFTLPGVFEDNPVSRIVNINLWTLPSELHCYLIVAVLLLTKVIYHRTAFTIAFIFGTIGLAVFHFLTGISTPNGPYPPHVIVYYFFVGALFYHFKDRIPAHFGIFLAALAVAYIALASDEALVYVAPIPLTYCTVFFGLVNLPKIKFISSGDYSYGIYLYGFPIAQTYMNFFPQLTKHVVLLVLLAVCTTYLFAAFSWHVIEKKALRLKGHLPGNWFPVPARAE